MSKIIKVIIFLSLAWFVSLIFVFSTVSEDLEKERAFVECLEEVKNECSSTINYAIQLEKENARINKLLRKCRADAR